METATAPNVVEITKRCTKCGETKPLSHFSTRKHLPIAQCMGCRGRYQLALRAKHKELGTSAPAKRCSACREVKAAGDFRKARDTVYGLSSACLKCMRQKDKNRYETRRQKHGEYQRWHLRKKKFGLTREMFEALLSAQDGKCAICKMSLGDEHGLHVDHCHSTGKTRGLLCLRCNTGIGQFKDIPERLEMAAAYLRRYGGEA